MRLKHGALYSLYGVAGLELQDASLNSGKRVALDVHRGAKLLKFIVVSIVERECKAQWRGLLIGKDVVAEDNLIASSTTTRKGILRKAPIGEAIELPTGSIERGGNLRRVAHSSLSNFVISVGSHNLNLGKWSLKIKVDSRRA